MGFLELRRQCGVSHEICWGAQGASRAAPEKSGLHAYEKESNENFRFEKYSI